MTSEQLQALREYIQKEVEFQLAYQEVGEDGYRRDSNDERLRAIHSFEKLERSFNAPENIS